MPCKSKCANADIHPHGNLASFRGLSLEFTTVFPPSDSAQYLAGLGCIKSCALRNIRLLRRSQTQFVPTIRMRSHLGQKSSDTPCRRTTFEWCRRTTFEWRQICLKPCTCFEDTEKSFAWRTLLLTCQIRLWYYTFLEYFHEFQSFSISSSIAGSLPGKTFVWFTLQPTCRRTYPFFNWVH